jgi:hypothetical protein
MREFMNRQTTEIVKFDEKLVRRLIEKVTVFEDKFTVKFKSGLEIDYKL